MHKGSMQGRIQVVEHSRCRTHRQQTTTIAEMQSQPSIHSLSPRERGFRQGCRNKDTPSFKHGCLQVVEQSRCRTHRQQTTTVAQKQSQQSVLKGIGIENKHFFEKHTFSTSLSGATRLRFFLSLRCFLFKPVSAHIIYHPVLVNKIGNRRYKLIFPLVFIGIE